MHPRTVKQKYVGPSRWEFLKRAKQRVGDFTLLGSGDLFSAYDVLDMVRETGVDGVTVARGCIGNPFVFQQVRDLAAGRTGAQIVKSWAKDEARFRQQRTKYLLYN